MSIEEVVSKHLQSDTFATALAEQIAALYGRDLLDEFNNEINNRMDTRIKKLIGEYIESYATQNGIENRVRQFFDNMSKDEIVKLLMEKHE